MGRWERVLHQMDQRKPSQSNFLYQFTSNRDNLPATSRIDQVDAEAVLGRSIEEFN
ncbi:uncharacterized protein isoform X2 [Rhodnius prolixus]|uniref:uncharacterized protein isoform X2 n=1 Tax=Rhodnius prolixus TaxID=13249 RepID=UPI003D18CF87